MRQERQREGDREEGAVGETFEIDKGKTVLRTQRGREREKNGSVEIIDK